MMQEFYSSPKEKIEIRPVKTRQVYAVGNTFTRTLLAAAKKEAWRMILGRYGELKEARPHGLVCDCGYTDNGYAEFWDVSCCYIHARYDGYFRRLHKRLTGIILKHWEPTP